MSRRNLSVECMNNVMFLLVVSEGIILWWVFIVFNQCYRKKSDLKHRLFIFRTFVSLDLIGSNYPEPLFDWIWLAITVWLGLIGINYLIGFDWLYRFDWIWLATTIWLDLIGYNYLIGFDWLQPSDWIWLATAIWLDLIGCNYLIGFDWL